MHIFSCNSHIHVSPNSGWTAIEGLSFALRYTEPASTKVIGEATVCSAVSCIKTQFLFLKCFFHSLLPQYDVHAKDMDRWVEGMWCCGVRCVRVWRCGVWGWGGVGVRGCRCVGWRGVGVWGCGSEKKRGCGDVGIGVCVWLCMMPPSPSGFSWSKRTLFKCLHLRFIGAV